MSTKASALFFSFTFTLLSIIGGCAIMMISFIAGGIYSAIIEPDNAKITPDVLAAAILVGFITYQLTVALLMLYMVRMQGISWRLRFSIFVAMPLGIFFLRGMIPPLISLTILMIISALAIYQCLVIHYRHNRRPRTEG